VWKWHAMQSVVVWLVRKFASLPPLPIIYKSVSAR
jgi:hypothetical protein